MVTMIVGRKNGTKNLCNITTLCPGISEARQAQFNNDDLQPGIPKWVWNSWKTFCGTSTKIWKEENPSNSFAIRKRMLPIVFDFFLFSLLFHFHSLSLLKKSGNFWNCCKVFLCFVFMFRYQCCSQLSSLCEFRVAFSRLEDLVIPTKKVHFIHSLIWFFMCELKTMRKKNSQKMYEKHKENKTS